MNKINKIKEFILIRKPYVVRKISLVILALTVILSFINYEDNNSLASQKISANKSATGDVEKQTDTKSNKSLVVYFSMPETNDPKNMTKDEKNSTVIINGEVLGNTQYVAYIIKEQTGSDLFRIEPETAYPIDHKRLVDMAKEERRNNRRPELKANVENIDQYETIFLGYPIWWSDFPMIIYSFLEKYDFSGKRVIPFSTHGGSGLAGTVETLKRLEPGADVIENAFTVSRDYAENSKKDVINWLKELGY
jgi:flavodoxin